MKLFFKSKSAVRSKSLVAALLALSLTPAASFAGEEHDNSGPYGSIEASSVKIKEVCAFVDALGAAATTTCTDKKVGYTALLGYRANKYFAAEVGATHATGFGSRGVIATPGTDADPLLGLPALPAIEVISEAKDEYLTFRFGGRGFIPLFGDRVTIEPHAGAHLWKHKRDTILSGTEDGVSTGSSTQKVSNDGSHFYYGVGLGYTLPFSSRVKIGIHANFTQYKASEDDINLEPQVISGGLKISF